MTRPQTDSRPLHERITATIIADLERGVRPWTKPWSDDRSPGALSRPLRSTGEPYRGINVLLLWAEAVARCYRDPTWMTFRQALALGGHVRKGEHGATVVYAGRVGEGRADDDAQTPEDRRRPWFLKAYTVFNLAQIEGLPEPFHAAREAADRPPLDPIGAAERYFAATGAEVRHGGGQPFYLPSRDYVRMPPLDAFEDAQAYYATRAHETVHWTGHPKRLARAFGSARFGDDGYAMEELVAELGAAFVCADLALALTPRTEHADYIGHWLKVLRNDPRAIFTAASHAQKAVDYLEGLQV